MKHCIGIYVCILGEYDDDDDNNVTAQQNLISRSSV